MKKSIKDNLKKRGRPATGNAPLVGVRMTEALQNEIRDWAAKQADVPALATAIRRLVKIGLTTKPKQPAADRQKARASEMADKVIDRKIDPGAPEGERVQRKRRLLKGPSEFIDARVDRPKAKK
jgi:hypothetical protein